MSKNKLPTRTTLDRTRKVEYDGYTIHVTTYRCSECKESYITVENTYEYCPGCGIKFKQVNDKSI